MAAELAWSQMVADIEGVHDSDSRRMRQLAATSAIPRARRAPTLRPRSGLRAEPQIRRSYVRWKIAQDAQHLSVREDVQGRPLLPQVRARSHCHFAVQLNHVILGFLSYSVTVFLT